MRPFVCSLVPLLGRFELALPRAVNSAFAETSSRSCCLRKRRLGASFVSMITMSMNSQLGRCVNIGHGTFASTRLSTGGGGGGLR